MTELFFVDTNLPVYEHDFVQSGKQVVAHEWMTWLWSKGLGRLSSQVLREFYSVSTGKLKPGLTPVIAREKTRLLAAWNHGSEDVETLESAWRLQDRYQLSWWDALIVAAAQAQGCRYLLSEDLQHEQAFDTLTVINPFLVGPIELR
jgi:predicted nucleic acid-binding protein